MLPGRPLASGIEGTMAERYQTFDQFWPFYLGEHRRPATRVLHYVGTSTGLWVLLYALLTATWWLIPMALVAGYGFAWAAHFFIEKNRPATFTYPWWSFLGDWKMLACFLTGRLAGELRELQRP